MENLFLVNLFCKKYKFLGYEFYDILDNFKNILI